MRAPPKKIVIVGRRLKPKENKVGIHAADNLSHLAHSSKEPYVKGLYDYDEFVIYESESEELGEAIWVKIGDSYKDWDAARQEFIDLFVEKKRNVKLVGRVFN